MANVIQLYVDRQIDEEDARSKLAMAFEMPIDSLTHQEPDAPALMLVQQVGGDFPMGIEISWPDYDRSIDGTVAARVLAQAFAANVLTDLPPTHPFAGDPRRWRLVTPDGELAEAREDVDRSEAAGGIVLDRATVKRCTE